MVVCSCSKTQREIQCIFTNLGVISAVFDLTARNVELSICMYKDLFLFVSCDSHSLQ